MEKIILYIRVSTTEQQEKGFSLQAQEQILRDYFKDYDIIKVIQDTTSGMNRDREGLNELREWLPKTNYVGAIDYDRLARDPKVMGVIEYWCDEHNVKILVKENPQQDEFVSDILSVTAKKENKDRIKRILRSKELCFNSGRHIEKPPLGYYYDKGSKPSVLRKSKDISIIKNIFDKRLENKGYLRIAKELNFVSKNGKLTPIMIRNILRNPFYCGYIRYKEKLMKGIHDQIISIEGFCKVNKLNNVEEINKNVHRKV